MSANLTRRSAVVAAATAVVGAIAGYIYGRSSDAATATSATPVYGRSTAGLRKLLARVAAIPVNGGVITSGVVITRSAGNVHAFSSSCTHLGCTVTKVSSGKIFCPCHGSVFDATTGAVVQGPASKALPPVHVTIDNGGVYLP